jgi:hypothetical protein
LIKYLFLIIIALSGIRVFGQNISSEAGISPELNLSWKINDKWKINSKIESFHNVYLPAENNESSPGHYYEGTDIQFFLSYRINPFLVAAIGYQHNIEPGEKNSNRTIQQISAVHSGNKLTFGHRIRSDQTFYSEDPVKTRFRYRFSLEIPLQGTSLDPGEFYLVASEETLYGIQDNQSDFENRVVLSVGHFFLNKNKVQLGIDYRADLSGDPTEQNFWLKIGWYVNL